MELQKEKFISATKKLVATLTRVVEAGRKEFTQIGGVQFSFIIPEQADAKGIRQIMEPTWTGYWKWLEESGVSTRKEIEQLWSSFGDDEEVLKCVNELHAAESKYNELTAQADADVQKEEDKVSLIVKVQCLQAVLLSFSINIPIFQYFACIFSIFQYYKELHIL